MATATAGLILLSSIWTDGVIGTNDDITSETSRSSYTNFDAAYTEAFGAKAFEKIDPVYAAYALKIAKDDFHWGITIYREQQAQHAEYEEAFGQFTGNDAMDLQVAAIGAMAATELYKRTSETSYVSLAKNWARLCWSASSRRSRIGMYRWSASIIRIQNAT